MYQFSCLQVDPTLTRADRLVGQVLGEVGALPDVFTEVEINFFLLRRLLGVRTQVGFLSCSLRLMSGAERRVLLLLQAARPTIVPQAELQPFPRRLTRKACKVTACFCKFWLQNISFQADTFRSWSPPRFVEISKRCVCEQNVPCCI